jgi:ubiquinone/menaquinone biosynthesis C-methylase UbiE/uncharacterized protein YbaR (Trm112 family)
MIDSHLIQSIVCPHCRATLSEDDNKLICSECNRTYPIRRGIPDFRYKDEYWCNVSREKMKKLNRMAQETGDWLNSAKQVVPEYAGHFIPFNRADSQFLWPTNKNSIILDAGSMWGGLTIPAAQFHREVYAVDKTSETLEFMNIRAKQMGLSNIYAVASSLQLLPFPDDFFDLVVLNGVLEWVAFDQDVVLEKHWEGRWENSHSQNRSPTELQWKCLKELLRVLKPGGAIFVAIENRVGIQYFIGHPDDHVNVRFVTFLPRFLANYITKKRRNIEYRTYIYSPIKLKKLIEKAGFCDARLYSVFPHYQDISRLVPFRLLPDLKSVMTSGTPLGLTRKLVKLIWKCIPARIYGYFSPSLAVVANKGGIVPKNQLQARIIDVLEQNGVIETDSTSNRYEALIVNSRFDDSNPAIYAIYDENQKRITYFCKIGRQKEAYKMLQYEAEQIRFARRIFQSSVILSHIPEIVQYGEGDGVPFLVTKFMPGKPVSNGLFSVLKTFSLSRLGKIPFEGKLTLLLNQWATKKWLKKVDPIMMKALNLLSTIQRDSTIEIVNGSRYLMISIKNQMQQIKSNKMLTENALSGIEQLRKEIDLLGDFDLPVCFQHGDYDLCNLLASSDELFLVDFEHSKNDALPFFDLGNILFNTLIAEWKKYEGKIPFNEYLASYGWAAYIKKWIKYYSASSGLPMEILRFLSPIAVLEQNAMNYPVYRDPYTYPMYGKRSLETLLQWRIW